MGIQMHGKCIKIGILRASNNESFCCSHYFYEGSNVLFYFNFQKLLQDLISIRSWSSLSSEVFNNNIFQKSGPKNCTDTN